MKLSEAMRKGSKALRQEFGSWKRGDGGGCALTMASYGCGIAALSITDEELLYCNFELPRWFPILNKKVVLPCGCKVNRNAFDAIIHLNDQHLWSAERIAGWIESHLETPTYSMLQMQEFMGEPVKEEVSCD